MQQLEEIVNYYLTSDTNYIEEFIGYVNSLVENENVKVLIIANENKIERQNYFALKEKVVGIEK